MKALNAVKKDRLSTEKGKPSNQHDKVNKCDVLFMSNFIVIPNVVVVAGFSDLAENGLRVFNLVAAPAVTKYGACSLCAAFFGVFLCYIMDFNWWHTKVKLIVGFILWSFFLIGIGGMSIHHPWTIMLCILLHTPITVGIHRKTSWGRHITSKQFYGCFSFISTIVATVILLSWIFWVLVGDNGWNQRTKDRLAGRSGDIYKYVYSDRELSYKQDCDVADKSHLKEEVRLACIKAGTVWFLVYSCPVFVAGSGFVMAIFAFVHGVWIDVKDVHQVKRSVKTFLFLISTLLAGLYVSSSLSSLSIQLGAMMAALFATMLILMSVWIYVEIGRVGLKELANTSPLIKVLSGFVQSDWARAMFVGGLNVMIPCYFISDRLRQMCRHRMGTFLDDDKHTKTAAALAATIASWHWVGVLSKICLLGELWFLLQVGGAKGTYIFLSWLNSELRKQSFAVSSGIVFAAGYIMFLLPPVPGVPVYVFCGIVLAEQGRTLESVGFLGGCAAAIVVSFVLKLAAVCGQYMIGYMMGRSLRIQKLIQVNKVPTRAIERILKRRGLNIGKVAVLVGGPDWPTSVTCGILHMNVFQMLLGTCPVVFVLTPCVMAGAFMSRTEPGEESTWTILAKLSIGVSAVTQVCAGLLAVVHISTVIENHGEELAMPRPEHESIEQLDKRDAMFREKYLVCTDWKRMGSTCKGMLMKNFIRLASFLHVAVGVAFCLFNSTLFRPFAISSDIDGPYDECGLDGDPMSIIRKPAGHVALGVFAFAVFLHLSFAYVTTRSAASVKIPELEAQILTVTNDTKDPIEAAAADILELYLPAEIIGSQSDPESIALRDSAESKEKDPGKDLESSSEPIAKETASASTKSSGKPQRKGKKDKDRGKNRGKGRTRTESSEQKLLLDEDCAEKSTNIDEEKQSAACNPGANSKESRGAKNWNKLRVQTNASKDKKKDTNGDCFANVVRETERLNKDQSPPNTKRSPRPERNKKGEGEAPLKRRERKDRDRDKDRGNKDEGKDKMMRGKTKTRELKGSGVSNEERNKDAAPKSSEPKGKSARKDDERSKGEKITRHKTSPRQQDSAGQKNKLKKQPQTAYS